MNVPITMKYGDWKIGQTVSTLKKNAKDKSQHSCAKYVRTALNAGGINTNGNPIKAQDYHLSGFLSRIGFTKIAELKDEYAQDVWTKEAAIPGDIAVMMAPYNDNGHICMWSGNEWISDFVQSKMRPYRPGGQNPTTCWIYRKI